MCFAAQKAPVGGWEGLLFPLRAVWCLGFKKGGGCGLAAASREPRSSGPREQRSSVLLRLKRPQPWGGRPGVEQGGVRGGLASPAACRASPVDSSPCSFHLSPAVSGRAAGVLAPMVNAE